MTIKYIYIYKLTRNVRKISTWKHTNKQTSMGKWWIQHHDDKRSWRILSPNNINFKYEIITKHNTARKFWRSKILETEKKKKENGLANSNFSRSTCNQVQWSSSIWVRRRRPNSRWRRRWRSRCCRAAAAGERGRSRGSRRTEAGDSPAGSGDLGTPRGRCFGGNGPTGRRRGAAAEWKNRSLGCWSCCCCCRWRWRNRTRALLWLGCCTSSCHGRLRYKNPPWQSPERSTATNREAAGAIPTPTTANLVPGKR